MESIAELKARLGITEEPMHIQTDGICAICGEEPSRLEEHHIQWRPFVMTLPVCVPCHHDIHDKPGMEYYRPDWQPSPKEKHRLYMARRRERDPEGVDAKTMEHYHANKERHYANQLAWDAAHPGYKAAATRKWRLKNLEAVKAYGKAYRKTEKGRQACRDGNRRYLERMRSTPEGRAIMKARYKAADEKRAGKRATARRRAAK